MKKSTQITVCISVFAILLIAMSGVFLYLFFINIQSARVNYSNNLLEKYQEQGSRADLLQAILIYPNNENKSEILLSLLEGGDYETAELLQKLSPSSDFYVIAAQASLFNLDYNQANIYILEIKDSLKRTELKTFEKWLKSEIVKYPQKTAETDAGKFMIMVDEKNFGLYTLNSEVGRAVTNNNKYDNHLQNLLLQSKTFLDYGLYQAALKTLSNTNFHCNASYYLIHSDIYKSMGNKDKALTEINSGLSCDPAKKTLIRAAKTLSVLYGSPSEALYLNQQSIYLDKIAK